MGTLFPIRSVVTAVLLSAATTCASNTTRPASRAASRAADGEPAADDRRSLAGARSEVYKKVGDVELKIHIFDPPGHKEGERRPAMVFFFGGGWLRGTPTQFAPQCRYLASRGMVAMTADYRVYERHQAMVADCVADVQSAIRWVRKNAKRLGVDPDRIAAGGGSAGGHLAAATGTLKDFTGEDEDKAVSFRPNALVLFNPALSLLSVEGKAERRGDRLRLKGRLGASVEDLSPMSHITKDTPPTIIFHGKADELIPYAQMEAFVEAMKKAGGRCELVGFEGQGHGFFNYDRPDKKNFIATTRRADEFLASLGYLRGEPTVEAFARSEKSEVRSEKENTR